MAVVKVSCDNLKNNPTCSHGPTLKFSRINKGVLEEFFACSTYRDRKDCSFYLAAKDFKGCNINNGKFKTLKRLPSFDHVASEARLCEVKAVAPEKRLYCHTCCQLDLETRKDQHNGHTLQTCITDYQLCHPSQILKPKEESKKEAQYLFSNSTSKVIVENLQRAGISHVLCVGTPRIHEYIQAESDNKMDSLLLDMDHRHNSFWSPYKFVWFNMFNRHILSEDSRLAEETLQHFMSVANRSCLVMDPPFGGHVEPLAAMVGHFTQLLDKLKVIWVFPYFRERHITEKCPDLRMVDYKVQYDNHKEFNNSAKGRKLGSPVRLFTNLDLRKFVLPKAEGYRLCDPCARWVSSENKHCVKCNQCPSKNGKTYVHCDFCGFCVKPKWQHCATCQKCLPVYHICLDNIKQEKNAVMNEPRHKKIKIIQEIANKVNKSNQRKKKKKKH